jgi:hypothetical protein
MAELIYLTWEDVEGTRWALVRLADGAMALRNLTDGTEQRLGRAGT